jgi:hypothetical protein
MQMEINVKHIRLVLIAVLLVISNLFGGCAKSSIQLSDAEQKIVNNVKAENPNCTCEPYLTKYSKNNEIFYVLQYKGPACTTIPALYDANGNQIINIANPFPDFFKDALMIKQVWSCQ